MGLPLPRAERLDLSLRPDVDVYGFVSMDDFDSSPASAEPLEDARLYALRKAMVPYAVDWRRRCMLFTLHLERDFAANHAFLYQAQRDQAGQGVTVGFDALEALFPAPVARPTFIFSVGRCGSTLAADLLDAMDVASASEPGVYEQLVDGHRRSWLNRRDRARVIRATTHALCAFMGEPLAIKLRAQCTMVAQEIAAATQGRCAMILRALEPWAMSTYRTFGHWPDNAPNELAWRYANAVKAFHALARAGRDPQLVWYEDMRRDPATLLQAVGAEEPLTEPQRQALAATYRRDSQEGLSIGRSGSGTGMAAEAIEDFMNRWTRMAPHRLLDRYGIADRL